MAFGKNNREKEVELTKEEKLTQLLKTQLKEDDSNAPILGSSVASSNMEAYLVFELVKSLNAGNCGMFHDRVKMAMRQLEEFKNNGINLNRIYEGILDVK